MAKSLHHGTTSSAPFFDSHTPLDVSVLSSESGKTGARRPCVALQVSSGAISLSYELTPEAARDLAQRLIAAADAHLCASADF